MRLFIKDIDVVGKRANICILLYEIWLILLIAQQVSAELCQTQLTLV